jgi:hypothetical protein
MGVQVIYPVYQGVCRVTVRDINRFFDEDSEDKEVMITAGFKRVPSMGGFNFEHLTKWLDPKFVSVSQKLPKIPSVKAAEQKLASKPTAPALAAAKPLAKPSRPGTSMKGRATDPLVKPVVKKKGP